ncbi:hypothetical protein Y032_0003g1290 [Ancylostoma ceylanicum]|uniref:Uncharacterized protein n=1 Tax=Ancylostoma ceylanicum TaxID=53326 RepID=A0A016VYP6_9BILA|nr:hypothetical protein Y032_0003g1290 [Ancylostoma ceylanicum]
MQSSIIFKALPTHGNTVLLPFFAFHIFDGSKPYLFEETSNPRKQQKKLPEARFGEYIGWATAFLLR